MARLRALNALFARAFADAPTDAAAPPPDAHLAQLLAKPHIIVLVASAGGTLAGGLVAYQLDKPGQSAPEIYLFDLTVDEPHRRRGIATALIAELQAIAARRGAAALYVQADPEDAPAIALYAKLGLGRAVLHFDIPPAPARP